MCPELKIVDLNLKAGSMQFEIKKPIFWSKMASPNKGSAAKQEQNLDDVINSIGDRFKNFTPLISLANKLNVPPGWIVIGVLVFSMICVVLGFLQQFIVLLIGYVYPGYMTFKAIESPDDKDDIQWMTYWIVFCAFTVVDTIISKVLFIFLPFPIYFPLKFLFIIWLFFPTTRGAEIIYDKFLRQFIKKHEAKIDNTLNKVAAHAKLD